MSKSQSSESGPELQSPADNNSATRTLSQISFASVELDQRDLSFESASRQIFKFLGRNQVESSFLGQNSPVEAPTEILLRNLKSLRDQGQSLPTENICVPSFLKLQIEGRWPGLIVPDNSPIESLYHNEVPDLFSAWCSKELHKTLSKELGVFLSILGQEADLEKLDTDGLSALHIAVMQIRPDCIKVLLKQKADIRVQSQNGQTPIQFLLAKYMEGWESDEFLYWSGLGQRMIRAVRFYGYTSRFSGEDIILLKAKASSPRAYSYGYDEWSNLKNGIRSIETNKGGELLVTESQAQLSLNWIHVPSTNGIVLGIGKELDKLTGASLVPPWQFYGRVSSLDIGLSNDLDFAYRDPICKRFGGADELLEIVFPILKLRSFRYFKAQRSHVLDVHRLFRTQIDSRYSKVQTEATLDEAYYPGLGAEALKSRNNDQVVTKQFAAQSDDETKPILMVAQLWIWQRGNTVLSAGYGYPHSRLKSWKLPRWHSSPALTMAAVITDYVHDFDNKSNYNEDEQFIPTLSIFKRAVVSTLTGVDDYMAQREFDAEVEYGFVHDISDIRDELAMILEVLVQQQDIIVQLLRDPDFVQGQKNATGTSAAEAHRASSEQKTKGKTSEVHKKLMEAQEKISEYISTIKKLERDAERIGDVIQNKLNLRRTAASIAEAHHARLLSLSVFGFTIITFIFTPLSFIASLLALNMDWFQNIKHPAEPTEIDGSGEEVYMGSKVIGVFLGTEFIALFLTLVLGYGAYWSFNHVFEKQPFTFHPKVVSTTLNQLLKISPPKPQNSERHIIDKSDQRSENYSRHITTAESGTRGEIAPNWAESVNIRDKVAGFFKREKGNRLAELPR
ncbi:unnamed protein product [Periconia digitata]|uniref:Ankyrin repeat protein n=1 Tax=Periconia digitata TaxID=1303443 RepID=A0A9W4XQZ0_9PLEO|nr:unnamed protein product [Periconia digitata]